MKVFGTKIFKKRYKEGGPGSGRHKMGDRVVHPYHGSGTYIKPNDRPGQSIVAFDKNKKSYDAGMSKGNVVSNDLIRPEMGRQTDGKNPRPYIFPKLRFKKKETDSASGQPVGILATKESSNTLTIRSRFIENSNPTPKPTFETVGPYKFRVVLIEEGMGNSGDAFFYPKEVLQAAAPLFEGKKIYADHPDRQEEQDRPERTVRDIVGHFENVKFELEEATNRGYLSADAVTLPDDPYRWARALMRHAVDYSSKYPDKLFIGISINAGGDAQPVNLREFMASGRVIEAVKPKLKDALDKGIETIRLVTQIQSVVSADMVTEPGAGGRVLAILESEKGTVMDTKKDEKPEDQKDDKKDEGKKDPQEAAGAKENPDADKGGAPGLSADKSGAAVAPADGAHSDEEQDRALIADMLKKALGDDIEVDEEAIKHAKEAYQGYKEMGYKEEDAMMHASHAMKLAHHLGKKEAMAQEANEPKDEEKPQEPKQEADKKMDDKKVDAKESEEILRLKGEIASLKESMNKSEVENYLEEKLSKSGIKREVTKAFKEAAKGFRSKEEIDARFNLFMEGYKQAQARVSETTSLLFLDKEETTQSADTSMSLSDCVEE